MLKLTVAVLALTLAGTASADNWRKLRVDASSEAAFEKSLAVFKDELTPARRYVFGAALKDIWARGAQEAAAAQREYTADDYYRQLHGLTYEKIVTFTDPSGKTARARYYQASVASGPAGRAAGSAPRTPHVSGQRPAGGWGTNPYSLAQQQHGCHCMSPNGQQGN
jgi:hypothetical protein